MRNSLLLALLILVIGAVPRLLQSPRDGLLDEPSLTRRQRELRDGEARAAAAEWIGFLRSHPDDDGSALSERLEKLDVHQLKRIIGEVRGSRDVPEETRREFIRATLTRIAVDRPEMALALFLESTDLLGGKDEGRDVLGTALARKAKADPAAAAEWIRRNAGIYAATADDETNREVIGSVAVNDPRLAFKLLDELPAADPADALHAIFETADGPEQRSGILAALRAHLTTITSEADRLKIRDGAFEALALNLGGEGIEPITRWISKSAFSPEETGRFAAGLSFSTTRGDTGRWVEWMASTLPAAHLMEPVSGLVGEWTRQDYQAAGKWLASTPEGPAKHAAVLAYAGTVAEHEPWVAGKWADTLPPGPVREDALKVIYRNWPGDDPEGAAAFARENGMD